MARIQVPLPTLLETKRERHRVSVVIDGHPLFFESRAALRPAPEAPGTAFALPAMAQARRLTIDGDVCELWLSNLGEAEKLCREWWDLPGCEVDANPVQRAPQDRKTGLFFTGGVDSFFSLRTAPGVEAIVFVEGFDIPLRDTERLARVAEWLLRIAGERGVRLIRVRTNLREHPTFGRVPWPRTHGAALAAVGHCLSAELSTILIASSDVPGPHGSHPRLDPLWSSRDVTFVNHGSETPRLGKVAAIADDPLVHRFLRVCWENRASDLNCGECEKCVRTQLQFEAARPGSSRQLGSFPRGSLARRVGRLDRAPRHLRGQWQDLCEALHDPRLRSAADAIRRGGGFRRRVRRRVQRWRARGSR